jgi:hypothetical protein
MANYNETTTIGTVWKRAFRLSIENPLDSNQQKYIKIFEENVVDIGGRTLREPVGTIDVFYNPSEVIELRDVNTGEFSSSSVSQAYLYQILYSLYRNKAIERDNTPDDFTI